MFFIVNEEIFYEAFGPLALPERKKKTVKLGFMLLSCHVRV